MEPAFLFALWMACCAGVMGAIAAVAALVIEGPEKVFGFVVGVGGGLLGLPGELRLMVARRRLEQARERAEIEQELLELQRNEHRAALRALEGAREVG